MATDVFLDIKIDFLAIHPKTPKGLQYLREEFFFDFATIAAWDEVNQCFLIPKPSDHCNTACSLLGEGRDGDIEIAWSEAMRSLVSEP